MWLHDTSTPAAAGLSAAGVGEVADVV